jgi:hypothetical protein
MAEPANYWIACDASSALADVLSQRHNPERRPILVERWRSCKNAWGFPQPETDAAILYALLRRCRCGPIPNRECGSGSY